MSGQLENRRSMTGTEDVNLAISNFNLKLHKDMRDAKSCEWVPKIRALGLGGKPKT